MSVSLTPPLSGGSGTFSVATWNIRIARGSGLAAAAKGLRQMGVGCCVLTETKLTDDRYSKTSSGLLRDLVEGDEPTARRGHLAVGGGTLRFRGRGSYHRLPQSPDVPTSHRGGTLFCDGCVHPPTDMTGVDDLRTAWAARPANCIPLLLGDLNIDFRTPRTEREEIIAVFLDEINVVDTSR